MGVIYLSFKNMVEDDASALSLPTLRTVPMMGIQTGAKSLMTCMILMM